MKKKYLVEYTEREHNFCFSGTWADEIVEAEDPEEAIDILMDCMIDWDDNPTAYIYRVRDYNETLATFVPEYDDIYEHDEDDEDDED